MGVVPFDGRTFFRSVDLPGFCCATARFQSSHGKFLLSAKKKECCLISVGLVSASIKDTPNERESSERRSDANFHGVVAGEQVLMLNDVRMRIAQIGELVRSNGWSSLFKEVLFSSGQL